MNRKAVLFLAAVMTAGSAVSAAAAETFADINEYKGVDKTVHRSLGKGKSHCDVDVLYLCRNGVEEMCIRDSMRRRMECVPAFS